jgi:RNA polymerase sigma-70 factor (ECF subfamily)
MAPASSLSLAISEHADPELASRARAGDARAFRLLFERHAPGVRRFLRDLTGNAAVADEATQETFVRAHRKLATIHDDAKVAPWLFGIARMVAHEHRRTLRVRKPADDRVLEQHAALAPTPEAALLGAEADLALSRALATLGEERRAALLLRLDHQLAYEDIADAMGWSLAKVKNEIHRARLALRAELADFMRGAS